MNRFLSTEKNIFFIIFFLTLAVTILGLPLDLIEPDGALYANISRSIYENNDWINLYSLGDDWLDKPHLPFWITAISFQIFGVSTFAYKIPAILIFFFGVFITYKFTKALYTEKTALIASVMLLTATHSVISNFDVRAEPYLTTFIISSVYFFHKYIKIKSLKYIFWGSLFAAFAIMTKGMFALIPIIAALGVELLVKRKWKEIWNWHWLLALVLIFIFILPEIYSLYVQFDLHPEKVIFGKKNVSGIKFFFWDSQFGRFFNAAPIKGSGDKFFFFHTILWAFLPWSILFFWASFLKVKRNIKKVIISEEFYSIAASLVTLIIFSLSKFQLAHYTNIMFPFMAMICADFIYKLSKDYSKFKKPFYAIQKVLNTIGILFTLGLFYMIAAENNYYFYFFLAMAVSVIFVVKKFIHQKEIKVFLYSALIFLCVYSFLFTHFYPTFLTYQSGIIAAKHLNTNYAGQGFLIDDLTHNFGFEFYLDKPVKRIDLINISSQKDAIFYVNSKQHNVLKNRNIAFTILKDFNHHKTSKMNFKILNSQTRSAEFQKTYLIKVN